LSFFTELRRRSVFKVGIAYAVTTWVLLQMTDTVTEILELPIWVPKLILWLLVVGFVPALIIAWAFELTPEGIRLEGKSASRKADKPVRGRKLDTLIIVSLGLSLGYFIWETRFEQTASVPETVAVPSQAIVRDAEPEPVLDERPVDGNSIAVLPFANRSADAHDIYFTDGIHDDLLTQLSRIEAFSVISRTSVMEYRDTTKNLRQIARELGVANVMEGSVQRSGDRVRINVQLIDANTDEHLWAEIYDRELTANNLFDIQSEIAKSIATALKTTLTDFELERVEDVPTENVAAYDYYLQAKRFAVSETMEGYQASLELLNESIRLDPNFKLAWTALSRAHMSNYWQYGGDVNERDKAREAIDRARSIDSDFGELYTAEGIYWYWGFLDYERALYNLDKAIDMLPGSDDVYMWRGWVSRRAGQWEQAVESMRMALKLNPRVHFNWHEYAMTMHYLHDYEEAKNAANQSIALDPDSFWGKTTLAHILLRDNGDLQTATMLTVGAQYGGDFTFFDAYFETRLLARRFEEALEAARSLGGDREIMRHRVELKETLSALALYFMGRHEEARSAADAALFRLKVIIAENGRDYRMDMAEAVIGALRGAPDDEIRTLIKRAINGSPSDVVANFQMAYRCAQVYAIAGMTDDAIELLSPLLRPPSMTSATFVTLDPAFDRIRDDPKFVAMLESDQ
jgi:TolB-like protein/Tfp pilus assembly protein PilF